jgi:S1-C subfamily serine protease
MLAVAPPLVAADRVDTIASVKRSVVGVGTFEPARSPAFAFRGTGFAVGDGTTIVTNAHVLPADVDLAHNEVLAILMKGASPDRVTVREVRRIAFDPGSDLALLKLLGGDPLPPLSLRDSSNVHEGQDVLITGFPIGAVLGPFPVTHRGMVSAVTPIAIPQGRAAQLDPALVHRLSSGSFPVFQLDATAYPGNSGSPVYDPATGEVLGVVNMVFVKRTKESALTDPSGITYAVPANHLRALLQSADGTARPKSP